MSNKTVHIISHSHWDREWYMPYEKFHLRLVDLIDQTIDLLESAESEFSSFHLDGHVLLVDDYLEIRPEQEDRIRKLVASGKLFVGPWYVLQDAFLTSGEAQIRNLELGISRAKQLGGVTNVGYFPDTFGNISQSPQMLRGFEIETAVFGRGINAIAENNTVVDNQDSSSGKEGYPTELWWESPDGSKVMSVYFANWYHNGMELPANKEAALEHGKLMLANVEKYATTEHLLLMNGCDHQPVQKDLGKAIQSLNEVLPNYTFIHSNFPDYVSAIRNKADQFRTVSGELTSEFTDGWSTLVNTASARMYLKQWNARVQRELEHWTEPFAAIAYQLGGVYPDAFIQYAWKLLLQNHPHDSICGCSVDEVHQEMITRFKKAWQVAEALGAKALDKLAAKINTANFAAILGIQGEPGDEAIPLIVFNSLGWERSEWVTAELLVLDELQDEQWMLLNNKGNQVYYEIEDLGWLHGFTLPDDRFRIPWRKRRYRLRFHAEQIPSLGYSTFAFSKESQAHVRLNPTSLLPEQASASCILSGNTAVLDNAYLLVEVNSAGLMTVTHKETGEILRDLLMLEDTGDIGNEYMFKAAEGAVPIVSGKENVILEVISSGSAAKLLIKHELVLPAERSGNRRSSVHLTQTVDLYISLHASAKRIEVEVKLDNRLKDHRLRVLFPTNLQTQFVHADAPFDVMKRKIEPWTGWTNPSKCERMQTFFDVSDGQRGLLIATDGLPEYEVLKDPQKTMALTLLRSVGELGDWNYFPTPEAQCLGANTARFAIVPHSGGYSAGLREAAEFNASMRVLQTDIHEGELASELTWLHISAQPSVQLTSLKKVDSGDGIQLRFVNLSEEEQPVRINGALISNAKLAQETLLNGKSIQLLEKAYENLQIAAEAKRIVTIALF